MPNTLDLKVSNIMIRSSLNSALKQYCWMKLFLPMLEKSIDETDKCLFLVPAVINVHDIRTNYNVELSYAICFH